MKFGDPSMWPEVAQKDDDTSGASSSIGSLVNLLHSF